MTLKYHNKNYISNDGDYGDDDENEKNFSI
jgi:hypothetical protein